MRKFLSSLLVLLLALVWSEAGVAADFGTVPNGQGASNPTIYTPTPELGIPGVTAGTLTLDNASNAYKTILTAGTGQSGDVTFTFPSSTSSIPGTGVANTWTALQTYTNSDIALLGSSTGKTTFTSDNAGASNFTMHVPAANDTLVDLAGTQTLTNKTLTSPVTNNPVVSGPAPVACGATCSPTTGQLILLNQNSGSTATIPTSSGSGNVIRFLITVATTSASDKILLTTTSDVIIGRAVGFTGAGGASKTFDGSADTYHSIAMPFAGSQPSGGFIGDTITCTDIAAGTWQCDIKYQGGTTPTTPYSTSTS